MLDGEQETVASASNIEIGVPPGPKVAATTQCSAGKLGSVLAGMMHECHGGLEGA